MAGNLLLIASKLFHKSLSLALRQAVKAIALKHAPDTGWGDHDIVIPLQLPGDTQFAQVIRPPKMKNLLFHVCGNPQLGILRTCLAIVEG